MLKAQVSFAFHRLLSLVMITWLLVAFQNCSPARFSNSNGSSNGNGDTSANGTGLVDQPNVNPGSCHLVLHQQTVPVKILFIVDTSGSNVLSANGLPPTDPFRVVRSGSIQAFFSDLREKPNFFWGFVTFSGLTATSLIRNGSLPAFSASPQDMQNAITDFSMVPDSGGTPYRAALSKALLALQGDTLATPDTKYIVVFLSDGMPDPAVADQTLAEDVMAIMNTKPGKVSFNTIYYGPTNSSASERLARMASLGRGRFLDTNVNPTGNSFVISNIINVPGEVCTP